MTTHHDDHGDTLADLFAPIPARRATARRAERRAGPDATGADDAHRALLAALAALHRRFDVLEQHAAEQAFLLLSGQALLLGRRRDFSDRSRALMVAAVAAPPYAGRCPCCTSSHVLDADGRPRPGAEFDHAFSRALNRPEHGWLICHPCHDELTRGGYLVRHGRMPEFRRHQAAVLAQRAQAHAGAVVPPPPVGPFGG